MLQSALKYLSGTRLERPRTGLQLLGTQDQIAEGRVAIETAVSCSHSAKMSVTQHNRLEATADKAQSLIFELMVASYAFCEASLILCACYFPPN